MSIQSELNKGLPDGITVILTVWKRDYLEEQISSLAGQTLQPDDIWIYQCKNFVDISDILRRNGQIQYIHSTVDLKYFGRFSLAQYVKTKYVFVLDDDVIPSKEWLFNAKALCDRENAIVSSAGRIIPEGDYTPERNRNISKYFFGDVPRQGSYNLCERDTVVDFGCNSWFLKTEWMNLFWGFPPFTFETGEDMHLSAICKMSAGIKTIVPKQKDEYTTGNLKIQYGRDEFASWTSENFLRQRTEVLRYLINEQSWRPMLWRKNHINPENSLSGLLKKVFSGSRAIGGFLS